MKNNNDMDLILDDNSVSDEEKLKELQQIGYEVEEISSYILKNY